MTNTPDAKEFFFDSLAHAAKEVMSQIAGCDFEVDISPETPAESALDVCFAAEGSLEGGFSLRFSAKDVVTASSLLMGEEANEGAPLTEDQREASAELSRQICGSLATTLRARFGSLELRNDASVQGSIAGTVRQLNAHVANRTLSLRIILTQKLSQALDRNDANQEQVHTQAPDQPSASSSSPSGASSPPATEGTSHALRDSNLAILLDLELPVTLRFGSCEMLLKDVMELTSGSVVELDRNVREPADLLIDNKLIARGEVVLVEGNYGLRVLEVANERDRLACLP